MVVVVIEDRQFEAVCRAIGREDLVGNARYATLLGRLSNAPELFGISRAELRRWKTAELVERARQFGAPLAAVNGIDAFLADAQVQANQTVIQLERPETGPVPALRAARRASADRRRSRRAPRRCSASTPPRCCARRASATRRSRLCNEAGGRRRPVSLFARAGIDMAPIRAVVAPIARVLAAARLAKLPVVYLQMGYGPDLAELGPPGSPNRERHLALGVGDDTVAPGGRPSRVLVRDTWNTAMDLPAGVAQPATEGLAASQPGSARLSTRCASKRSDAHVSGLRLPPPPDCSAEPIGADLPAHPLPAGHPGVSTGFLAAHQAARCPPGSG